MSDETIVGRYYGIYKTQFNRLVTPWARKVGTYEQRRQNPFGPVCRQVDTAMRRYLGAAEYERVGDLLTFMAIKEGLYIKDEQGRMDITPQAFAQLAGEPRADSR